MNDMPAQSAVLPVQVLSSSLIHLLMMHPSEVSFTLLFKATLYLHAFQMLKTEYLGIPG